MFTVMPSPIGDLRIVEREGTITAIDFHPFRDGPRSRRGQAADQELGSATTTRRCWRRRCAN